MRQPRQLVKGLHSLVFLAAKLKADVARQIFVRQFPAYSAGFKLAVDDRIEAIAAKLI